MSRSNQFAGSWETPDNTDAWPEPPAAPIDQLPMVPLTAPAMPVPGPDFVRLATALGDPPPRVVTAGGVKACTSAGTELTRLYKRALYDPHFALSVNFGARPTVVRLLPGHLWFAPEATGPRKARVLMVGKCPGLADWAEFRNFSPRAMRAAGQRT